MSGKSSYLILISLFLGGLAWGLLPARYSASQLVLSSDPSKLEIRHQIQSELGTFAKLAKELKPSVVNISVVRAVRGPASNFVFPSSRSGTESTGQGSGVIISSDGDVLTNNHVIDGARTIRVKLADGRELEAEVVGTDSSTDLALLKLKEAKNLPVAKMGDSEKLAVGDWVMAIGNPFGLEATVTVGVLSGKGRVIGVGNYDDFLQTDASINPGNSGGPLFNTQGEVVGINTAIIPGGQGIGFSIPINLVKEVSSQLKSQGRVVRGFIGVGVQPLTPALKSALELPSDAKGALVSSLMPNGPGERARLRTGDLILEVAGQRITSDRGLLKQVARLEAGREVSFRILRDGVEKDVAILIMERPSRDLARADGSSEASPESKVRLGVAVRELGREGEGGVLVVQVLPNSPAARSGLRRGDIIRSIGSDIPLTAQEFVDLVTATEGELALLVERQGRTVYVVVD